MNNVCLLLSDARGVYIPRDFVQGFDMAQWGLDPNSWAVQTCAEPDADGYWDAWNDVMGKAKYVHTDGRVYRLHQDGDLWALCYESMTAEERSNFGMEE